MQLTKSMSNKIIFMKFKKIKIKIKYKKLIPKIGKVLYGLIFSFLIITAGVIAISKFDIPGSFKFLAVQSGSMEPSIKTGSVVVVKPVVDYKINDVITVSEPANPKVSVTHRIVEIKETEGNTLYVTKGDANTSSDVEERPRENVLGKVLFSVPFIGYPIGYAKTRNGLLILIIIPATIIIYNELLTIKNEAKRLLKERRKRKLTEIEKIEVEIGEEEIKVEKGIGKFWKKINKPKFLTTLLLVALTGIKLTNSYFIDQEVSIGNTVTAGTWAVSETTSITTSDAVTTEEVIASLTPSPLATPTSQPSVSPTFEPTPTIPSEPTLMPEATPTPTPDPTATPVEEIVEEI